MRRRHRRRVAAAVSTATAVVVLALAGLLAAAAPAGADPGLDLSLDGVTWTEDVTALLVPGTRVVPGGSVEARLYVRNGSGGPASGRADVELADDALGRRLSVRTSVAGGDWTDGLRSAPMTLADGAVAAIDLALTLDPAAGNDTQSRSSPLLVRVTLEAASAPGAEPPPAGATSPAAGGPGGLAATGTSTLPPVAVGAVLVVLGSWLVGRARGGVRRA